MRRENKHEDDAEPRRESPRRLQHRERGGDKVEASEDLLVVLLLGVVTTLATGSRLCALALDTAGTSTTVGRGESEVDVL